MSETCPKCGAVPRPDFLGHLWSYKRWECGAELTVETGFFAQSTGCIGREQAAELTRLRADYARVQGEAERLREACEEAKQDLEEQKHGITRGLGTDYCFGKAEYVIANLRHALAPPAASGETQENVTVKEDISDQYGRCPYCGAKCALRERRPFGNDTCVNGHVYPSATAVMETQGPDRPCK